MKCGFQTTDGAPEQFVLQTLAGSDGNESKGKR